MKITKWEQLIGHRQIVRLLRQQIHDHNVQDVILLYGPTGLGKTSVIKLLACEVVSKGNPEEFERQAKSVIIDEQSTDSIKLFNMSSMRESAEEIAKVTAEFSLGFATNGDKFIICDEAHGMTKIAQDAILTELEHLDQGIHVAFLTTEVNTLRQALVGRCRTRLQFRSLNGMEISKLITNEIKDKNLSFQMPLPTVVTMISYYADNQPRAALNLLTNFKDNTLVTNEDLSIFMNVNNAAIITQLVKYLYGSMVLGLDYISTLEIDTTFVDMLVEVTKVAMGGKSRVISSLEEGAINQVIKGNNVNNLIRFTIDVTTPSHLTQKTITAAFMRNHASMKTKPERDYENKEYYKDLATIESVERDDKVVLMPSDEKADEVASPSFNDLLRGADMIREDK